VRTMRANLLGWLPELRNGPPELLEALDAGVSFELWDRMRTDQRLGRERATATLERIVLTLLATLGRG